MTGPLRDIRSAIRVLLARPIITIATLLSLTLGMAACTAIFSVVYGVLLKSLPYPDPDRIVEFSEISSKGAQMPVAEPNFNDERSRARGLEALSEYTSD